MLRPGPGGGIDLDRRVTALIEDLQEHRISRPDGSFDPEALAERIVALHGEVGDEESRVELIKLYDALMSTSDNGLIAEGRDPGPLREVWRRTHLSFILAESLTEGGEVDADKLARVNAREIAAGRLHPDETVRIQKVDQAPAAEPGEPVEPARLRSGSIGHDDYPPGALRRGDQGAVSVEFTAAANGRVEDVKVVRSSGSADLDEATCRIIERRFRYAPARDARGEPVPQKVAQTVRWQLDEEDGPAPEPPAGRLKSMTRGLSRLFGGGGSKAPAAEPAAAPEESEPAAEEPSALERAYRALFLWEEERMEPRIDALVEELRLRLAALEDEPDESFRPAAERETLLVARRFEEDQEAFLREAVSYLDDEIIQGLKAMGVDQQFHGVIFEALNDARGKLAGRLSEARDAACAKASPRAS
jgi:TonB family protein